MSVPNRSIWMVQAGAILLAAGIAGALGYSYLVNKRPPIPQRVLRIGFEPNPPFQIRTNDGIGGLAVDTIEEAAKRSGIRLQWIETGTSSEEAFQKRLVDLWALMADVGDRRKRVYLSRPWMLASHVLVLPARSQTPDPDFNGRVAIFKLPLHVRLLHDKFPQAQPIQFADSREALLAVCRGSASGAFLEKRVAMIAMNERPEQCEKVALRVQAFDDTVVKTCVASSFEAAGAADRLRDEIGKMYRDGSLGLLMAKYSFYGLDDTWATYELMEAADRSKWTAWGIAIGAGSLLLALVQAAFLRLRKREQRVLRESEERFRAIFQRAGVGVAQIGLDGKVELANDQYCAVVGHSRDRLMGKGTVEITHTQDIKEQLSMMPRLLSGEIASFSTDKQYTREDGSVVWAEVCKSLVRSSKGEPIGFIAVVKDITARKQAEATLKESEARFRNMADSAPVMVWISGLDGRRSFVNKRWLDFTGRTMAEELGSGWIANLHPDDQDRVAATYKLSFDALCDCKMEYRMRRADGEYRQVMDQGVVRHLADGVFGGYVGSCLDITDLKHNFERHAAAQNLESLGVLTAGMAHDFNNLLGAIVARAESACSELEDNGPATNDIEQIRSIALRAAEIVTQLITFSGTGKRTPVGSQSVEPGGRDARPAQDFHRAKTASLGDRI